jgi:hypothetical protein
VRRFIQFAQIAPLMTAVTPVLVPRSARNAGATRGRRSAQDNARQGQRGQKEVVRRRADHLSNSGPVPTDAATGAATQSENEAAISDSGQPLAAAKCTWARAPPRRRCQEPRRLWRGRTPSARSRPWARKNDKYGIRQCHAAVVAEGYRRCFRQPA